ncbi:MAG: hypothetical protein QOF76_2919 [Solirubrobacteraceae bacterium]|nr:hypothetical protein [Solirubrobacteraceae bacterium]
MAVEMEHAEPALCGSGGDQVIGGGEPATAAQFARCADRGGTDRRRHGSLRKRSKRPIKDCEGLLISRAGQDLERRDWTYGDETCR